MKKILLPGDKTYYKANLHCHSTLSDGKLTVEQIKEAYQKNGYSVVAFSDHDDFFTHNDLTDENFVAINSYEAAFLNNTPKLHNCKKCYHFCCYAKTNDGKQKVIPVPKNYNDINEKNEYIKKLNDEGFLVCYNHPNWSLQTSEDVRNLDGLWGCEVFNFSSTIDGFDGNMEYIYDVILRDGKRIFCVATDDNHNVYPFDDEQNDSFGGYIMIFADCLTYDSIINAMEKGNFYASSGPSINELYIEDGIVHVSCSPARHIRFTTNGRYSKSINAVRDEFVTNGEYKVPNEAEFVRVQITGIDGTIANSNAYWLK